MISPLDISRFDYDLPPELIAQHPTADRSASRLLHLDSQGALHDLQFADFLTLLRPHDLLVFNDTRVIKARLHGHKDTGGRVEVLIERVTGTNTALAHVRSSKPPRAGSQLVLEQALNVSVQGRHDEFFALLFPGPVYDLLEQYGSTPLPPYITHAPGAADEERYQTVYARQPGAVAAPTAGLHFDDAMLSRLQQSGIGLAFVTLHVGAGTFQPVRVQRIDEHIMHAEHFHVPAATVQKIQAARQAGGRIIAVGTTSARALEAAASQEASSGIVMPAQADAGYDADITGETRIFITPGYHFQWVDALLTNFHLPRSTLLMMVSALAGLEPIQRAYAHAVQARYRFFSYGDAMFIESH